MMLFIGALIVTTMIWFGTAVVHSGKAENLNGVFSISASGVSVQDLGTQHTGEHCGSVPCTQPQCR